MEESLSPSAQKVQNALEAQGLSPEVVELPAFTRTAVEAAQAIGCQVGQIVTSLVFKTKQTDRPILVVGIDGEFWSPRKMLRRALWHEKDHTEHIKKLIV